MSSPKWLRFRLSLSMRWSRFGGWLMKKEPADQPATVRMALGHFPRDRRDDGPDGR
jgi:hypothetical protein